MNLLATKNLYKFTFYISNKFQKIRTVVLVFDDAHNPFYKNSAMNSRFFFLAPGYSVMFMRFKNILRAIVVPNSLIAGLLLAGFPAMPAIALVKIVKGEANIFTSGTLIADIATIEKAADNLEVAAVAVEAIAKSKNHIEEHQHFSTAIYALKSAADALDKAGIPNAAVAMDRALAAVNGAAKATDSRPQKQAMIDAAIQALNQVEAAIDQAAS